MRIDTTVVESNIHYPTDGSLLGNGVRVLTRAMRKITQLTGQVGAKLRDRSRGVGLRLLEIARAARGKAPPSQAKMKLAYGRLLNATGRVTGQAKRFSKEITAGVKHSMVPARQMVLEGHRQLLDEMLPRVQQVIRQTKARIFHGDSRSEGKIVSLFEPSAEVIRKGKASKPTEFIPNRSSKSAARKREQKKRWFRNGQRWRTGCEGRISVSKRRHGLNRCRYRGDDGMQRWVGLGVIADNLINVGLAISKQSAK